MVHHVVARTNGTSIGHKLDLCNELRIANGFILCRPAVPQPLKGPKKAETSWRRAIRLVNIGYASVCNKMTYAKASAIRRSDWVQGPTPPRMGSGECGTRRRRPSRGPAVESQGR